MKPVEIKNAGIKFEGVLLKQIKVVIDKLAEEPTYHESVAMIEKVQRIIEEGEKHPQYGKYKDKNVFEILKSIIQEHNNHIEGLGVARSL